MNSFMLRDGESLNKSQGHLHLLLQMGVCPVQICWLEHVTSSEPTSLKPESHEYHALSPTFIPPTVSVPFLGAYSWGHW